jgi:hypothetical protein
MNQQPDDILSLLEIAQLKIRVKIRTAQLTDTELQLKIGNPYRKNEEDISELIKLQNCNAIELNKALERLHDVEVMKSLWMAKLITEEELREKLSDSKDQ